MGMFSRMGAIASLLLLATVATGHADERPLIWSPAKNSDTSYAVKLGLRLPTELEPEAGLNLGLDASTTGAVIDTPVKFWGRVTAASIKTPAFQLKRDIRVNLDAVTGSGLAGVNMTEKRIATETLDVELSRQYGVRYDGAVSAWKGEASQSVKLSRARSGTAVILQARALDTFREIGGGISVEQKIGQRLSLSGSLDQSSEATALTSNISARYSFKW